MNYKKDFPLRFFQNFSFERTTSEKSSFSAQGLQNCKRFGKTNRVLPEAPLKKGALAWGCVFLFTVLAFFVNCTAGENGKAQSGLEVRTLEFTPGGVKLEAEIARTRKQQTTGLMFRKELPVGKGMLFVFERDEVLSFWMKNTFIPLSIAFINYDGEILEIKDMYPNDLSSVHSSRSVRYALEVPQGWFAQTGIKPGDRVSGL